MEFKTLISLQLLLLFSIQFLQAETRVFKHESASDLYQGQDTPNAQRATEGNRGAITAVERRGGGGGGHAGGGGHGGGGHGVGGSRGGSHGSEGGGDRPFQGGAVIPLYAGAAGAMNHRGNQYRGSNTGTITRAGPASLVLITLLACLLHANLV